MESGGALAVYLEAGQVPRLAEPVPEWAKVHLAVLRDPLLLEWLIIDGSHVELDGHRFRIEGWDAQLGCMEWHHLGATVPA